MVGLRPSSSLSTGCVVLLRGDCAIFCHAGSERVGRVWSAREKSLEILRHGWELNPGHGEDRQWAIPPSYHDPGHGEDRQWAIPLSHHDWNGVYKTKNYVVKEASIKRTYMCKISSYTELLLRALIYSTVPTLQCREQHWLEHTGISQICSRDPLISKIWSCELLATDARTAAMSAHLFLCNNEELNWRNELSLCLRLHFTWITRVLFCLLLTKRERWIFYNRGVILTLIHGLGPPWFLVWWSEPTLAIWSERLTKGPYQKPRRQWGLNLQSSV